MPAPTRTEHCAVFPIGTTLLFYTDGLIERRGSSLDARLAELLDALSEAPGPLVGQLQAWCDEVVARASLVRGGRRRMRLGREASWLQMPPG